MSTDQMAPELNAQFVLAQALEVWRAQLANKSTFADSHGFLYNAVWIDPIGAYQMGQEL